MLTTHSQTVRITGRIFGVASGTDYNDTNPYQPNQLFWRQFIDIRTVKIVPDLRIFEATNVSRETGRKRIKDLAAQGIIEPKRTPTGRCLLSFEDAERLANAL